MNMTHQGGERGQKEFQASEVACARVLWPQGADILGNVVQGPPDRAVQATRRGLAFFTGGEGI